MSIQRNFTLIIVVIFLCCNKKDFLDKKPSDKEFVPSTPANLQELLDNEILFGQNGYLNFITGDEITISDSYLNVSHNSTANAYLWRSPVFDSLESVPDWDNPYVQIYTANLVLEGVARLTSAGSVPSQDALAGDAYFKRAFAFYRLAQIFAPAYDSVSAAVDRGIPLRLTTDSKEKLDRRTVQATYDQIIADLQYAIRLLPPVLDPAHLNRGSQPAAYALLSRTYLSMGKYQQAAASAEICLNLYDSLIDFNQLNKTVLIPFDMKNGETLYQSKMIQGNTFVSMFYRQSATLDSSLIRMYEPGDLRDSIFFITRPNGTIALKGSLFGEIYPFTGIGTSEVILTLAECDARLGYTEIALQYLNKLLSKRWKTGQYIPRSASTAEEAKQLILGERRKELLLRGTRWTDLRRLHKEGANFELKRISNQTVYRLPSDDSKWVLPIPPEVLRFHNVQ